MTTVTMEAAVRAAVAGVDDPEFPGVSISDLGMVGSVDLRGQPATVEIELLPTFLGCPALEVIEADVKAAALSVAGVEHATVRFVNQPVWTAERVSDRGRELLARQFTVAVPSEDGSTPCPRCAAENVEIRSPFGPTACRAIAYCASCVNPLEVMRG